MLTIDRIEENVVVLDEDGRVFNADKALFDGEIAETLVVTRLENGRFKCDKKAAELRKKKIEALQDELWE